MPHTSPAAAPPPPLRLRIREVTARDAPALARLYAASFSEHPCYSAFFEPAQRDAALTWLFERRVAATLAAGGLFLLCEEASCDDAADDNNDGCRGMGCAAPLAGAALVRRTHAPGLWRLLRAGMGAWPLRWGWRSALRALAMQRHAAATLAQQQRPEAAAPLADAELLMVAVAPGMQRRGAGSALLRELLSRWDDDGCGGGAVVLGTHHARSLLFYERAGFAVTAHITAGERAGCCWVMRRDGPFATAALQSDS